MKMVSSTTLTGPKVRQPPMAFCVQWVVPKSWREQLLALLAPGLGQALWLTVVGLLVANPLEGC